MTSSPFDLVAVAKSFWVDNALAGPFFNVHVIDPLVPEPGMDYFVVFGEPGDTELRIDMKPVSFVDDEGQGWQCLCGYDGLIFVTTQREKVHDGQA